MSITIIYNNTSFDRLIAEKQMNLIDSSTQTPSTLRLHLIQNGEHFLILSRIERQPVVSETKRVFKIINEKYSLEDSLKKFPGTPKSRDRFIEDISKFPLLELDTEKVELDTEKSSIPVEHEPPKYEPPKYFDVGKKRFLLSPELQKGISGIRGSDHIVSHKLIQDCIKKIKSIPEDTKTDRYFFVKEKNRVLNLVIVFQPSDSEQQFPTILTAYYPTDNVLKHRLNDCSDIRYEAWKKSLPKV